jgi:hypothetical protein
MLPQISNDSHVKTNAFIVLRFKLLILLMVLMFDEEAGHDHRSKKNQQPRQTNKINTVLAIHSLCF